MIFYAPLKHDIAINPFMSQLELERAESCFKQRFFSSSSDRETMNEENEKV